MTLDYGIANCYSDLLKDFDDKELLRNNIDMSMPAPTRMYV